MVKKTAGAANLGGIAVGTEKVLPKNASRKDRSRFAARYTGLTDFVVLVNENKQANKLFQYHHLVPGADSLCRVSVF